ncbi:hypothetical protein ACPA9J_04350 [Pseudomonas aeruginosa]
MPVAWRAEPSRPAQPADRRDPRRGAPPAIASRGASLAVLNVPRWTSSTRTPLSFATIGRPRCSGVPADSSWTWSGAAPGSRLGGVRARCCWCPASSAPTCWRGALPAGCQATVLELRPPLLRGDQGDRRDTTAAGPDQGGQAQGPAWVPPGRTARRGRPGGES